jgi:hypothetical protein
VEAGKKTSVVVWVGVAAAAAGIVAVAAIAKWREHSLKNLASTRGVQEVLADCYNKIHEIEEHLPDIITPKKAGRQPHARAMSNGHPVLES